MDKVLKPVYKRRSTSYVYNQEDVLKALGFNLNRKRYGTVQCDGINRVTVEIYEADT